MKKVSILGSTGSVGSKAVELINNLYKDKFEIQTLSCNSNVELLLTQINDLKPKNVVIADQNAYNIIREKLKNRVINQDISQNINVIFGKTLPNELIYENDLIIATTVGLEVLEVIYLAIKHGIKVATSSKEIIVCGGKILSQYRENIIPLDSEHHAIYELNNGKNGKDLKEIILTATGGPFFGKMKKNISIEDALNHPIWKMGKKNSIDSATMMNKVLELIEAHYLFDIDKKNIKILIHPEAIVHGIAVQKDGTQHAFISSPDMRIGINAALLSISDSDANSDANSSKFSDKLSLAGKNLTFFQPDSKEFPAIDFINTDQEIVLNAANEIAVEKFLSGEIKFSDIIELIKRVLDSYSYRVCSIKNIDDIINVYNEAKISIATAFRVFQST